MKPISVHQLADGMYLVKTDGTEGPEFTKLLSAMRWYLESERLELALELEPETVNHMRKLATSTKRQLLSRSERALKLVLIAFRLMGCKEVTWPFDWNEAAGLIYVRTEHMTTVQFPGESGTSHGLGGRLLKRELLALGLLKTLPSGAPQHFEKTINGERVGYMVALQIEPLRELSMAIKRAL